MKKRWISVALSLLLSLCIFTACGTPGGEEPPPSSGEEPAAPAEPTFSHLLPVQDEAAKLGSIPAGFGLPAINGMFVEDRDENGEYNNIIENFYNMYHGDVVKVDDEQYPYRMYFFGWADSFTNENWPGADAIFMARGKNIDEWEVLATNDDYTEKYRAVHGQDAEPSFDPQVLQTMEYYWDTEMDSSRWASVIFADLNSPYDDWHNGDPSVVYRDGKYYMVYSGYGTDLDRHLGGTAGDTDGDISCVMAATSDDGIHWTKSSEPILIWEDEIGKREAMTSDGADYRGEPFYGLYHRPSVIWDDEAQTWKMWFDYISDYRPSTGLCRMSMGYAEAKGDMMKAENWTVIRKDDNPALYEFANPEVEKIGDIYYAVGDPAAGFHGAQSVRVPTSGWNSRQVVEAMSLNGQDWVVTGYLEPDEDTQANQIPTLYYEDGILVLFYAPQVGNTNDPEWDIYGNTYYNEDTYDYRYFAIRYKLRYWDYQQKYGVPYWDLNVTEFD